MILSKYWIVFTLTLGISTLAFSASFKILDDQKKVIIYTHDSNAYGHALNWWISEYYKSQGKSNPISFVRIHATQSGMTKKDGKWVSAGWPASASGSIKVARSSVGPSGKVVFVAQSGMGLNFLVDTTDQATIKDMNDEIEAMCDILKDGGADMVFASTFHMQWTHRRYGENEPVVVRTFNARKNGHRAIDVVTPTMENYPEGTSGDKRHLNSYGGRVAGFAWFSEICKHDGIEAPAWSKDSLAAERKKWQEYRNVIRYTGPFKGKYRIGETIKVTWEGECSDDANQSLTLFLQNRRMDSFPELASNYSTFRGGNYEVATWKPDCKKKEIDLVISSGWASPQRLPAEQKDMIPSGKYAMPIQLTLLRSARHGTNQTTWTGSNNLTCGHGGPTFDPDNVILIYPSTGSPYATTPVYPGFWGKRSATSISPSAKQRNMISLPFGNGNSIWNIQGRKISQRTELGIPIGSVDYMEGAQIRLTLE